MTPGSVAASVAQLSGKQAAQRIDVEHPTGFFTVDMEVSVEAGKVNVRRSALLRTARKLMRWGGLRSWCERGSGA